MRQREGSEAVSGFGAFLVDTPANSTRTSQVDRYNRSIPSPYYVWPDHATSERSALWHDDPNLSRLDALKTAFMGERRDIDFYYSVVGTTKDSEIAAMANEFVKEEAEHVAILERWIERETYVVRAAKEAVAQDSQV